MSNNSRTELCQYKLHRLSSVKNFTTAPFSKPWEDKPNWNRPNCMYEIGNSEILSFERPICKVRMKGVSIQGYLKSNGRKWRQRKVTEKRMDIRDDMNMKGKWITEEKRLSEDFYHHHLTTENSTSNYNMNPR